MVDPSVVSNISPITRSNGNFSVFIVKQTDACLKDLVLASRSAASGSHATITLTVDKDGRNAFTIDRNKKHGFSVSSIGSDLGVGGSLELLSHTAKSFSECGPVVGKLQVAATDAVYNQTMQKAMDEKREAEKKQTKQIKSNDTRKPNHRFPDHSVRAPPRPGGSSSSFPSKSKTPLPPPSRSKGAPIAARPSDNPSTLTGVARRPIRQRIIQCLILKQYAPAELRLKLKQDGLEATDSARLEEILKDVGTIKQQTGKYFLKRECYKEVQADWQFYDNYDRQKVRNTLAAEAESRAKSEAKIKYENSNQQNKLPTSASGLKKPLDRPADILDTIPKISAPATSNQTSVPKRKHLESRDKQSEPIPKKVAKPAAPAQPPLDKDSSSKTANGIKSTPKGRERIEHVKKPAVEHAKKVEQTGRSEQKAKDVRNKSESKTLRPLAVLEFNNKERQTKAEAKWPAITAASQFKEYSAYFEKYYSEYDKMREQVARDYAELEVYKKQRAKLAAGSEERKELERKVRQRCLTLREDAYHNTCIRMQELHCELTHVKKMITEYDKLRRIKKEQQSSNVPPPAKAVKT